MNVHELMLKPVTSPGYVGAKYFIKQWNGREDAARLIETNERFVTVEYDDGVRQRMPPEEFLESLRGAVLI